MKKSNTILSKLFYTLSICFLYVIGLLQGLLAKISTSHKMSDFSIQDYHLHIKKLREVLKEIEDNTKKINSRFNKYKNYFILKHEKKNPTDINNHNNRYYYHEITEKGEEKRQNCPGCFNYSLDPEYNDSYSDPVPDKPGFIYANPVLNCICCKDYENKKKILDPNHEVKGILVKKWCTTITFKYCIICGGSINSRNGKINCENEDHFKEYTEIIHKEIHNDLTEKLKFLLELEYLHNLYEKEIDRQKKLYIYPEINVVYTPDIVTMNVLAFHLETNLFFIHNNNIFELVCEYLYDKNYYRYAGFPHNLLDSFKYCLENVTQNLNFYFSDKYFTLNTNQYYEFQSTFTYKNN